MIITNGTKLYHGSYAIVSKPDLKECKEGKDFGRGFYVTTDFDQARRFVNTAVGKALKNGIIADSFKGYVNTYIYNGKNQLKKYLFETADSEWLHCVAAHRRSKTLAKELERWEEYDLIAGKIANDNTNQVITAYINGLYGKVGSESADLIAIGLLNPENLTDQICFRTQRALSALVYNKSDEVALGR